MDGVAGVTQCPIPPGSTFIYNITISESQSGTFWYHSHAASQRADGLYGGFIIHPKAPQTHDDQDDRLLLISDWYHRSADQVLAWFLRPGSYGNEVWMLLNARIEPKRLTDQSPSPTPS